MRTKIVYVIVSSKRDVYVLQAWVSICSLKKHNPDAHVLIVCDSETNSYLSELPFYSLIDEIVSCEFDKSKSAMERSRLLKTNLRELIDGDFLYIDTDTIITASLEEIDDIQDSICAVNDSHCGNINNPYKEMNNKNAAKLGYSLDKEVQFFNGGVIFAKDDSIAKTFYSNWNKLYNECVRKGIFIDQTSFAKANIDMGHVMRNLPDEWNCQLRHGVRFLKDAKIVHYLWTAKRSQSPFLLGKQEIWENIRNADTLPAEITELFDNPFKGIQDMTYLASSEETARINGRIYKVANKFEQNSRIFNNLLKFCVKTLDVLYKILIKQ